jgi:hypothetical protein
MGGRYGDGDVRRADYHKTAAFHHERLANTYSQVGFGQKAASHRRRAKWHAAFGTSPEEEAHAFHVVMPGIRKSFEDALAAIQKITDDGRTEIHRVAYDQGRAETNAKNAKKSVRAFANIFKYYLTELNKRVKVVGGKFYMEQYIEVGGMIDTLNRRWANVNETSRSLEKTSIRENTQKATGARVLPEVLQTEEALAAGAQTLLGIKIAHDRNFENVRIRPPAPDPNFKLYDSDEDSR